jgi:hypothetical protein
MSLKKIEFTKRVVFSDRDGNVLKVYEVGDKVDYTTKSDNYWITSMGGIYFDEAKELENDV